MFPNYDPRYQMDNKPPWPAPKKKNRVIKYLALALFLVVVLDITMAIAKAT